MVALLAGCSATALRERGLEKYTPGKGERLLLQGIQAYENGQLKQAGGHLNAALGEGLLFSQDKVSAYKYLAFIDCSTGATQRCREHFVAAVAIDPDMELSPAEASHPVWGPLFKSVKARRPR